jgi:hypothetical protein
LKPDTALHGHFVPLDHVEKDDVFQEGLPQAEQGLQGVVAKLFEFGHKQQLLDLHVHRAFTFM